ncbi:MAG: hypothetical protein RLZZ399_2524 [Verrucomicrobiota bacterium]|jgi:hypothetical protein
MSSFDSSTRVRYWKDRGQEFLHAFPAFAIFGVFMVVVAGITLSACLSDSSVAPVLILIAGVMFSRQIRALKPVETPARPDRDEASSRSGASSQEVDALLAALRGMEGRLNQMEGLVTSKEYEWERRLHQTPPPPPGSPRYER